ncbi:hypothetical protein VP1G_10780 [Cytospora mali]|uniref:Uncharacterized protein n=1 Tax=Cytospora mali TaxID=578113 RepID=A0A194UW90_CYTMA|nr:hypothetical protein VP1G_10780 [Valsa mali var. pyri (nom. inval.)]
MSARLSRRMSAASSPGQYDDDWSQTESRSPTEHPSKRRRTASIRHSGNQEIGLMRDGGEPDRPRFVGSGSGIYFVRTVYDILARSSGTATGVQSQLVPGEDDQLEDAHEPREGVGDQRLQTSPLKPWFTGLKAISKYGTQRFLSYTVLRPLRYSTMSPPAALKAFLPQTQQLCEL